MKTLQFMGLLLASAAITATFGLLGGLGHDASASAAGAAGLAVMSFFPVLCIAAVMLIPTSLALLSGRLRARFGIIKLWHALWLFNLAFSILTLGLGAWVAYFWFNV